MVQAGAGDDAGTHYSGRSAIDTLNVQSDNQTSTSTAYPH